MADVDRAALTPVALAQLDGLRAAHRDTMLRLQEDPIAGLALGSSPEDFLIELIETARRGA